MKLEVVLNRLMFERRESCGAERWRPWVGATLEFGDGGVARYGDTWHVSSSWNIGIQFICSNGIYPPRTKGGAYIEFNASSVPFL